MIGIVAHAADQVGGISELARLLKISYQAMYAWEQVPPGRVRDIERLTGVSRVLLRPDLYGWDNPRGMTDDEMIDRLDRAEMDMERFDTKGLHPEFARSLATLRHSVNEVVQMLRAR